jgi:hypothetical protein
VRILGLIARKMTPAQIAGAQTLWRQCIASDYKNCVPAIPSSPQLARRDEAAASPSTQAEKGAAPGAATEADTERRGRAGFPPASDRAGTEKRCLQIESEEVEKTTKCFADEYERLGHNQTESAGVVADAIVGRCRAANAGRMNDTFFPFCSGRGVTAAEYDKAIAPYFAHAREAVLSQIVEERTPGPQPRPPSSQVARGDEKAASPPAAQNEVTSTGTGFFVSDRGHMVTNAHVVDGCQAMRASSGGALRKMFVDEETDLALYIASERPAAFARLRGGRGARPGERRSVCAGRQQGNQITRRHRRRSGALYRAAGVPERSGRDGGRSRERRLEVSTPRAADFASSAIRF